MYDPPKVFVTFPGKMFKKELLFSVKLNSVDIQLIEVCPFFCKIVYQLNLIFEVCFHLDLGAFRLY